MPAWLLLAAVVSLSALVLYLNRQRGAEDAADDGPGDGSKPAEGPESRRWHSVSIVVPDNVPHCEAVSSLRGRRFLSTEAPKLPLATCDVATCECRYEHYQDRRRRRGRRATDHDLPEREYNGPERRESGDRRADAEPETESPEPVARDYFER